MQSTNFWLSLDGRRGQSTSRWILFFSLAAWSRLELKYGHSLGGSLLWITICSSSGSVWWYLSPSWSSSSPEGLFLGLGGPPGGVSSCWWISSSTPGTRDLGKKTMALLGSFCHLIRCQMSWSCRKYKKMMLTSLNWIYYWWNFGCSLLITLLN